MKSVLKEVLSTSIYILIALCISVFIVKFIGVRTEVNGASMNDTLMDGDNLIVDKISYRFKEPQRFDIVVFPYRYAEKTFYIKRVIGLPGETVYIDKTGNIFINDELLEESYGREIIKDPGRAYEPVKLDKDEYFVMGDNRNNSSDSRDPAVGSIKKSDLIGKAWVRIWPLSKLSVIKHQ